MEEIVRRAGFVLVFYLLAATLGCGASQDVITLPDEAVSKKTLENGLTVLAKHSLPQNLAAIDVKIRAGSGTEDEYLGSGISHLVEHMVFKGTRTQPVGAIEKELWSYGGIINGSTSSDMTDYYIVIPSKYLPQAISILKDMLMNAKMDPAELAREKEVVLKEIRLEQDEPQSRLMRILHSNAYLYHPYKFPVIGYEASLKALTASDLLKYYNKMYVPNRIAVSVVGDIDESDAISLVEKEFADFRRPDYAVPDNITLEPPQISRRNASEHMDTSLAYLAMGFHSTGILSEDLFSMDLLAAILGRGDNSRLTKSLYKDKRIVHTITSWNYTPKDPGLFVVTALLDEDNVQSAENEVIEELARIRTYTVSDDELNFAKRALLADYISVLGTVEGRASDLASGFALTGSEDFSRRYLEGINAVTKEDVRKAANKYLRPNNLTTVAILPKTTEIPNTPADRSVTMNIVKKDTLPNGLRIVVREDNRIPSITITAAALGALQVESDANNGLSYITADMILRGTKTRPDSGKIKGRLHDLGGEIDTFCGANTSGVSITVLKPDLDLALEILKDVLVNADFSGNNFDMSKTSALAEIRSEDNDIFDVGMNTLKRELFQGSPYALRYTGGKRSAGSLNRDDVLAYYKKYYVPSNIVIAISGDVDAEKTIAKVRKLFSDIKGGGVSMPAAAIPEEDTASMASITMDREESLSIVGFKTVPRKSPDRYALEVLSAVMSGSSGRLFSELRDKLSLAYTLGCWQDYWTDTGVFAFYAATTKDKLPETRKALLNQILKLKSAGISDEELEHAKRQLISRHLVAMQSNEFLAMNFAVEELRALGYDNIYKYEREIGLVTKDDLINAIHMYIDLDKSVEVIISSANKKNVILVPAFAGINSSGRPKTGQ